MKKEVAYAQTWIYDVYTKGEAYYADSGKNMGK